MDNNIKHRGRPSKVVRKDILENALNLYWEKGIDNVSIYEIAKYSSVSRAAIYREFNKSSNLKVLTLREYEKLVASQYYNSFNNTRNLPKLLITYIDEQLKGKNRIHPYCYLYTTRSLQCSLEKDTKKELNRIYNKLEESICVAVERGKKDKLVNNILNTKDMAKAINSHLMNVIVMDRADVSKKEIKNITKLFIHSITRKVF